MSFLSKKLLSVSSAGESETTDPDFSLVTGLYPFDGSNGAQNNTLLDSSPESHTVTRNADIVQGSFSPFSSEEGKWSVSFDGTDDYLSLPNHSDFTFGSGNWTVEAFVNVNAIDTNYKCIYSASYGVQFYVYNNQLHLGINDTDNTSGWMITANSTAGQIASAGVWYHVAAYRDGSNFYCSVDGVVSAMGTSSATIATPSAQAPSIGIWGNTSLPMNGYISNLRVIKGTALYGSSNFTAPSSPLTAVTNTKLLTCCSNRFRDKSTSAHRVAPNASGVNHMTSTILPKVQPFSPFAPSAAYDSAVNGGSGFFDQTSDCYFDVSDATDFDFGTGDYTVEMWVYPTTTFIVNWAMAFNTINVNQYWAWTDGGGNSAAAGLSTYPSGNYSGSFDHMPNRFSWSHIVFQNTSGTENWYINGVRVYNATNNPNFSASATGVRVGLSPAYASMFFYGGYISDVRVLKGSNAYSNASTLTVPTAPLGSVTNTKLLTNFTNAAMFDQSGKTNIDTVGNAQLNTSIKKFGTASAKFDGTGDYLHIPRNFTPIGTGDYTIELFAYFTGNSSTSGGLFASGNPSSAVTVPAMALRDTTGLTIYTGAGQKITGNTGLLSLNTWYHLAMVRASGVIKVFKDGSLVSWDDGSSTVSDTSNITSTEFVIGKYYSDSYLLNGYIDEFRISLKARYTSNFTAPSKEFPNR
tara:strand:+ start:1043 stop:3118 length:2076 start_codon:yes stop_codon:yes gene_type:complete